MLMGKIKIKIRCCFGKKVKPATQNVPDEFPEESHPFRGVGQLQLCNIILTWADSEDANETDIHYF